MNDFADVAICVPTKDLDIRPGAALNRDTFGAVRVALGARPDWPRSTPKVGFYSPGTIKEMKQ